MSLVPRAVRTSVHAGGELLKGSAPPIIFNSRVRVCEFWGFNSI
jgi:hypothetical protein